MQKRELYWPNGKIKRRCFFIDGIRSGLDQMWNEEGILVDEGSYENGKPVGAHRRWNRKGALIEEMTYLDAHRFDFRQWDEEGNLRVEAIWEGNHYREKVWDRFQEIWVKKKGYFDGKKLIYG